MLALTPLAYPSAWARQCGRPFSYRSTPSTDETEAVDQLRSERGPDGNATSERLVQAVLIQAAVAVSEICSECRGVLLDVSATSYFNHWWVDVFFMRLALLSEDML